MRWHRAGIGLVVTLVALGCGDFGGPDEPVPPQLFVSTSVLPLPDTDVVRIESVENKVPVTHRFFLRNGGTEQLSFTITTDYPTGEPINWLTVTPSSGTLSGGEQRFIYLDADISDPLVFPTLPGVPEETYATLTIDAPDVAIETVEVKLLRDPQPTITVTSISPPWTAPNQLSFTLSDLQADLDVGNNGAAGSVLNWVAVPDQPWLQLSDFEGVTADGATTLLTVYAVPNQPESWGASTDAVNVDARFGHVAVWTGKRMLIWGGWDGSAVLNTGTFLDPSNGAGGAWSASAPTPFWPGGDFDPDISGAPNGRTSASAVWTGAEMIIWGGWNGIAIENTGHIYNPDVDAWTGTITTTGAPSARYAHSAVWTGAEMIIWGGFDDAQLFSNGAAYDPIAGVWAATITTGAPVPRSGHSAVWTGNKMIVWGGWDGTQALNNGASYTPASASWDTGTQPIGAPTARYNHTAVWTGMEMIVWGGGGTVVFIAADDGGRLEPIGKTWEDFTPAFTPPSLRWRHTAVWTGRHMIVWGGETAGAVILSTGKRYQPPINLSGNLNGTLRIEGPRAGTNSIIDVELTLP